VVAAYVNSLTTHTKSPFRNGDGTLTADGLAGKAIFDASGCAACHTGAALTDSVYDAMHDVGTIQQPGSGERLAGGPITALDTPTLHGVWDSGPYLHDGSANTMAEAVTAHQGVSLSGPDTDLVVAYLEQIDTLEPAPSDGDADGAADSIDNCVSVSNGPLAPGPATSQVDTDGDGYGNMCDADFNDNGIVDSNDASRLFGTFGMQSGVDIGYDPEIDLNSNGVIDSNDASALFGRFGQPPGPSGITP
jgi:cytochrome c551/c552